MGAGLGRQGKGVLGREGRGDGGWAGKAGERGAGLGRQGRRRLAPRPPGAGQAAAIPPDIWFSPSWLSGQRKGARRRASLTPTLLCLLSCLSLPRVPVWGGGELSGP